MLARADAEQAGSLRPLLSLEELARSRRFLHGLDTCTFSQAHGLKRWLLSSVLGRNPDELEFRYTGCGKPELVHHPDLFLSLSHTREAVAVAVTRLGPCGIDVEGKRELTDIEAIAAETFSQSGVQRVASARDPLKAFMREWTMVEAASKSIGCGLVASRELQIAVRPLIGRANYTGGSVYVGPVHGLHPDLHLAWACARCPRRIDILVSHLEELAGA